MSSRQAHVVAARLALVTAVTMFALMVLGSVVRATGAGLACPDWPLCHGQLIPPFDPLVWIEWFHRLMALVVSVLLFATVGFIFLNRELRLRLAVLGGFAAVLLMIQILLGALTVWKLLDPSVVSGHLAVAMLLFGVVLLLSLVAGFHGRQDDAPLAVRPAGLLPWLVLAAGMTFAQILMGGIVSSNHAGLACPDWPTCHGQWFPPLVGPEGLQMLHRYGAYLLAAVVVIAAVASGSAPDATVRTGARLAVSLVLFQVFLGVSNVLLGTPAYLSAAHLGVAIALFAVLVALAFRAAMMPAGERQWAKVGAP